MAASDTAPPTEEVGGARAGPAGWFGNLWADLTAWMREDQESLTDRLDRIRDGHYTTTDRATTALLLWTRYVHGWYRLKSWASVTPGRFAWFTTLRWLIFIECGSRIPILGGAVPEWLLAEWWLGHGVRWSTANAATIGAVIGTLVMFPLLVVFGVQYIAHRRTRRAPVVVDRTPDPDEYDEGERQWS